MENIGYIKLWRKIRASPFYSEKRVFSKNEAWIDILLSCNFKNGKMLIGNEVIKVKAGSFITSKIKLEDRYSWGQTRLKNFLNLLEELGMITHKTIGKGMKKGLLIVVLNYSKYQDDQYTKQLKKQYKSNEEPLDNQSQYNKNNKNKKNNNINGMELFFGIDLDFYKDINGKLFFKDEKFCEVITKFIKLRIDLKSPLTNTSIEMILKKASNYSIEVFIEMIEQSLLNSRKNIYEIKNANTPKKINQKGKNQKEERMKRFREYRGKV